MLRSYAYVIEERGEPVRIERDPTWRHGRHFTALNEIDVLDEFADVSALLLKPVGDAAEVELQRQAAMKLARAKAAVQRKRTMRRKGVRPGSTRRRR